MLTLTHLIPLIDVLESKLHSEPELSFQEYDTTRLIDETLAALPGYRMKVIVWEGDEEFPPNSQILYTDNFAEGFAAEDRVVAGDILITVIKAHM